MRSWRPSHARPRGRFPARSITRVSRCRSPSRPPGEWRTPVGGHAIPPRRRSASRISASSSR
eukprot:5756420-Pyramimonas_sp.AAC.1